MKYWERIDSGMPKQEALKGLTSAERVEALGYENSSQIKLRMKHIDEQLSQWADSAIDPYGAYKRLSGEAESRLTQSRMNMDAGQRAAQYPWEPQYFEQATGVPLKGLLFRYE